MLARDGWCVFGRAVEPALIAGIDADLESRFAATPLCQGAFYGERTKRFGSLLTRSAGIECLTMHPLILEIVEQMLLPWCERIALNLTQAIEIHPGALPQLPHRDQDMWQGPKGSLEYLVNVMWPLTTFTRLNGGTRLWTGSQFDQDIPVLPEEEAVVPTVSPGDALIFLGSTLHGGGGNASPALRRGIVISYCLGWLKPFELHGRCIRRRSRGASPPNWPHSSAMPSIAPTSAMSRGNVLRSYSATMFRNISRRSMRCVPTRTGPRRCSSGRRWVKWAEGWAAWTGQRIFRTGVIGLPMMPSRRLVVTLLPGKCCGGILSTGDLLCPAC